MALDIIIRSPYTIYFRGTIARDLENPEVRAAAAELHLGNVFLGFRVCGSGFRGLGLGLRFRWSNHQVIQNY